MAFTKPPVWSGIGMGDMGDIVRNQLEWMMKIAVGCTMFLPTARKPTQRFCVFLRCDMLGGGCNNVLCLRYHRFSSANTLHVTLHTSVLGGG